MSRPNRREPRPEDLGLPVEPGSVYELAVTHRSFAFEQPQPAAHNERLEFLGDAIVEAVVTDLIYRSYPEMPEGQMARLRASVVNTNALAEAARRLTVGDHMRLGRGEEASGGRDKPSLLANTLEALVGAMYLDRGIDAVADTLGPMFEELVAGALQTGAKDAKGALQEALARIGGERPEYRVAGAGPDHDKRFVAHVYVDGDLRGVGTGTSKREAETNAAREALAEIDGRPGGTADARAS